MPETEKSIKIYRISGNSGSGNSRLKWSCHYKKSGRPLSTVFLDDELKNRLLDDTENFLVSENWYKTRNIPYRRGYLLYGQTGCGKSSLVTAICSELNLSIYWIQLNQSNPYLNDRNLINALNTVPKGQVILIENIDRLNNSGSCITLPGILNALDGPIAHTGHLVFFTANSLSNLDKSLIRPGRIDSVLHIPLANKVQIRRMFKHIYNSDKLLFEYVNQIPNNKYPMCLIQSHLIKCKDSQKLAVDTIKLYLDAIKIENDKA
jgi:chaperone BCS1